jgi:hypothetical protein
MAQNNHKTKHKPTNKHDTGGGMRIVSILLAVLTFLTLTYVFVAEENASNVADKTHAEPIFVAPAFLSDKLLVVEQIWPQIKAERNKKKQPPPEKPTSPLSQKSVLSIGDNKYALYGIFNANQTPSKVDAANNHNNLANEATFILIKALANKNAAQAPPMLKVMLGQTLENDIVLVSVSSNSIRFMQHNEVIDIKLFEPQN